MGKAENFIGDVEINEKVHLQCFVEKEKRKAVNQNFYWSLTLTDQSGHIFATIFEESQLFGFFEDVEDGDYLSIRGVIGEYNGSKNVLVAGVKKLEQPESFIVNTAMIKKDLGLRIRNMEDPGLQDLLFRIFKEKVFAEAYFNAPLTENPNSAGSWRGGASAFVSKLCLLIDKSVDGLSSWEYGLDEHKTDINKDFLIALAILEPIGKMRAFTVKGNKVKLTREGELFGEHYLTMEAILQELPYVDLPDEKKLLLKHAIASVPGKDFEGSLIQDRTREAVAFNMLWNLTFQMMNFEQLERTNRNGGEFVKLYRKTVSLEQFQTYKPIESEEAFIGPLQSTEATEINLVEKAEGTGGKTNGETEGTVDRNESSEPTVSLEEALSVGR